MWKMISKILEKTPEKSDIVVLELCQRHRDHSFMKLIYSNSCSRQIGEQDVQELLPQPQVIIQYMRIRVLCTDKRQIKASKIIVILLLILIIKAYSLIRHTIPAEQTLITV